MAAAKAKIEEVMQLKDPDVLQRLTVLGDKEERIGVAINEMTNTEDLEMLGVYDIEEEVRAAAAANPKSNESTLAEIALDPNKRVIAALLKNPSCPDYVKLAVVKIEQFRSGKMGESNLTPGKILLAAKVGIRKLERVEARIAERQKQKSVKPEEKNFAEIG